MSVRATFPSTAARVQFLRLFIIQSLALCAAPLVVFVGGLIGQTLAPDPAYATFPIAAMVLGTALASWPMSRLMQRIGRRRVFQLGLTIGICGALIASGSASTGAFAGFCAGTLLLGMNLAVVQQYRFAAMESVKPEYGAVVTARLMLSGLIAAVLGPELPGVGQWLFGDPAIGGFLVLAGGYVLAWMGMLGYRPPVWAAEGPASESRGDTAVFHNPWLWLAIASAAIGYAVMSFMMTATPLSMHQGHGHSLEHTKWVIQSHILAMFLPSLLTPFILSALGLVGMIGTGIVIYALCLGIGWMDTQLLHYWVALVLLGLGWNFLFVGGTGLLHRCYAPADRFRVQSVNDLMVFGAQAIAALSAGWVLNHLGWSGILALCVPLLGVLIGALITAGAKGKQVKQVERE